MEFLAATFGTSNDFVKKLPTATHLMSEYGLEAGVAFDIVRPSLRIAMTVRQTVRTA